MSSCDFTLIDKHGNPVYTVIDETLFGITTESIKPKTLSDFRFDRNLQKMIHEASASFKGQNELIEHVINLVKTASFYRTDMFTKKYTQINVNNVKDFVPWLDMLTITIFWYFRSSSEHCDGESTNITSINKPINGYIKLYWYGNDLSNIAECLAHELLHLHEGYKRSSNNASNLSDFNKKYNQEKWQKIITDDKIHQNIQMFIVNVYNCFDHEINANASTIYPFLKEKNANNEEDVIFWTKQTDAYKKYASILYTNCPFYSRQPEAIKQQYYNYFKQVYPTFKHSFDKTVNLMREKSKYAIKKIFKNASLYINNIQR